MKIDILFVRTFVFLLCIFVFIVEGRAEDRWSDAYRSKTLVQEVLTGVATRHSEDHDINYVYLDLVASLEELVSSNPKLDYTILKGENTTDAIAVLVGHEDQRGFIGWKFDLIFTGTRVLLYQLTLKSRSLDDTTYSSEDYYQWKVIQ